MKIRHPAYGVGSVVGITEHTADILFEDGKRTISPESSAIEPAEAIATVSGTEMPLKQLIERTVGAFVDRLGIEKPENVRGEMALRFHKGTIVIQPADKSLQSKEIDIDTFFHKVVMMRNQLRVLEQKLNAHDKLTEAEKVEMQSYITRCYGTMTTFNVLFREKDAGF